MRQVTGMLVVAVVAAMLPVRAAGQCEILRVSGDPFDLLGDSVGVHGDWLVYTRRQTVRVMRWSGGSWRHHTTLAFPNLVRAVDVHGDVLAAGVLGDNSVSIFRFDGSDWVPEATLLDRWSPSILGSRTLDLHADLLITSDPLSTGAWVWRDTGGEWVQEFEDPFRWFSVATDGNRFLLGNETSFWIHQHDGSQWIEEYAWSPTWTGGARVDISGAVAATSRPRFVGTPPFAGLVKTFRECGGPAPWCEDPTAHAATGDVALLDGVMARSLDHQLGLFRDLAGQWDSFDLLSGSGADDAFGEIVEMDDEWIVVGARHDDTNGSDSGTVYVFRRDAAYVAPQAGAFEFGTCAYPHDTIDEGLAHLPASGVLVISAGTYAEAPLVLDAPARLSAAGGIVRID